MKFVETTFTDLLKGMGRPVPPTVPFRQRVREPMDGLDRRSAKEGAAIKRLKQFQREARELLAALEESA